MSSRLMPPKVGSSALTIRMISSGSCVFSSMSNTSMSANLLNRTPLPSMTGLPASAPMSPRPEHRRAVRDDRHEVALARVLVGELRVLLDREAGPRHAGRVGQRQVALGQAGLRGDDLDLPGPRFLVVLEDIFVADLDHGSASPGMSGGATATRGTVLPSVRTATSDSRPLSGAIAYPICRAASERFCGGRGCVATGGAGSNIPALQSETHLVQSRSGSAT